jgi:TonB-dependent starch-binding outer membrane protein SusC
LGYNVKARSIFTSLRLYAMIENLFWFKSKSYQSPDPERIDLDPIPVPKTFTFGVNASF